MNKCEDKIKNRKKTINFIKTYTLTIATLPHKFGTVPPLVVVLKT
jgi:hypothetical protein